MAEERDRRDAQGFPELSWLPGECQVDFGEADLGVRGVTVRGKYLTAAFPHPDVGLAQVFWGETSNVKFAPVTALVTIASKIGRASCRERV